jgi:large subunit ribosomal protein L15
MPIYRRLPKRGFRPLYVNQFATVRLEHIQALLDKGLISSKTLVTHEDCIVHGLASRSQKGIRIVAGGVLKKPVIIEACGISSSARVAFEKVGGEVILPTN